MCYIYIYIYVCTEQYSLNTGRGHIENFTIVYALVFTHVKQKRAIRASRRITFSFFAFSISHCYTYMFVGLCKIRTSAEKSVGLRELQTEHTQKIKRKASGTSGASTISNPILNIQ